MKLNGIKYVGKSVMVNMGPIQLRQPIPTQQLNMVDPFILLHHYGPYHIDERNNPFDLGPHPHRGFEPITFLIQGEQKHRDSLGNESLVRAGDVQWTTAGSGIIHAEGPSSELVKQGGVLEGIQLWLNLPADKKMMQPKYQHITSDLVPEVLSEDRLVAIKVIAGMFNGTKGKITTQTAVNAFMIDIQESGVLQLSLENSHQSLLYLLHGKVLVNNEVVLESGFNQLIEYYQDGEETLLKASKNSKLLFLSGEPLKENVASWGPYVMNTQTEIMEALRDYQQGKMGFLSVS